MFYLLNSQLDEVQLEHLLDFIGTSLSWTQLYLTATHLKFSFYLLS